MNKKEFWAQLLGYCRTRYNQISESERFKEGNIDVNGVIFAEAQFTSTWQSIVNGAGATFKTDVEMLRTIVDKAVELERTENDDSYLGIKKKIALEFIKEKGEAFEHEIAKAVEDNENRLHCATTKTVIGFLEKENKIVREGNVWKAR